MYHPYKTGYSVLPNLKKIGPWSVFQPFDNFDWYMGKKKEARKTRRTAFVHEVKPEALGAAAEFVAKYHPLNPTGDFFQIARRIPEDVALHVMDDKTDWLAACDVSFPSGWYPDEKIGKPLAEIHAPIPGMNLDASRKMVEMMTTKGPFERFVWSVVFDADLLDYHPMWSKPDFDPDNIFVKVERQVTVPLQGHRAALFVLRQYIITDVDRKALADAVGAMTAEQLEYKGLDYCRDELVAALTGVAHGDVVALDGIEVGG